MIFPQGHGTECAFPFYLACQTESDELREMILELLLEEMSEVNQLTAAGQFVWYCGARTTYEDSHAEALGFKVTIQSKTGLPQPIEEHGELILRDPLLMALVFARYELYCEEKLWWIVDVSNVYVRRLDDDETDYMGVGDSSCLEDYNAFYLLFLEQYEATKELEAKQHHVKLPSLVRGHLELA